MLPSPAPGPLARRINRLPLPVEPPKPVAPKTPAWIERRNAGLLPGKVLS